MHWSDEIAQRVIEKNPDKEVYTCAAGYSPSGSGHIGNFRDIATSLFVAKALERKGKRARLLLSWDEFDRMRKVPANVAALPDTADLEDCIGKPYVDVRNPFRTDAPTYAAYFEREFQASIERFGIRMEYRHQAELYRSGAYRKEIRTALEKRHAIFDILDSMRTQDAAEPEKTEKVFGDPDPVEPVSTEQVSIDEFHRMDMRVCRILKCQEIRKSHNCYKLTLADGIGERVIVSSIKHDYTPEELVGRKIIVLANLTPARITGVTSDGMLLAATNNACGCQVIFVDDSVPEGTKIH